MTTVQDIYTFLDTKCPRSLSCEWDNDGMMCVSDRSVPVAKLLCAMDLTDRVIEEAEEEACTLILTHHPVLFHPLAALNEEDPTAARLMRCLEKKIAVLSFHTRLDAAEGGVNDTLCEALGLKPICSFGENGETLGRIAELDSYVPLAAFAGQVKKALGSPVLHIVSAKKDVRRLAVLGGSGKSDWKAALAAGADTYLTGEMSYSAFLDAKAAGLNVIAAGHFYTERPVLRTVAHWLTDNFADLTVTVSALPNEVLSV